MVTNKFSKKKSKRVTCKQKYKVAKKVREHNRKLNKSGKGSRKKFSKKELGVPNLAPFKEKVIQEYASSRTNHLNAKIKKRGDFSHQNIGDNMEEIDEKTIDPFQNKSHTKAFYKSFAKVVEDSDVIIEVLDARNPLGTRSTELEQKVLNSAQKKHLILLLNKADLVPRDNLVSWIEYLRKEHTTVAFKASTQEQNSNLAISHVDPMLAPSALMKSKHCVGAAALMKLLAKYTVSTLPNVRVAVTVGVVGFPNVGKSSVINSLKRGHACDVGCKPGVTRSVQEVKLDSNITLMDCPGVVLPSNDTVSADLGIDPSGRVAHVEHVVETVMKHIDKKQLMLHYNLPAFNDMPQFLCLLARRSGRILKGGSPDIQSAARRVLSDWNSGKILFHTELPESASELPPGCDTIVQSELGDAFNLEDDAMECQTERSDPMVVEDCGEVKLRVELSKDVINSGKSDTSPKHISVRKARKQVLKKKRKDAARLVRKVEHISSKFDAL